MSYLYINDYKKSIQHINLQQVIGSDMSILASWERTAEEKAVSYLIQKYDTDGEFTNTNTWDPFRVYLGGDRVYLDADVFNPATAYTLKSLVLQAGQVHICVEVTTPGTFNPSQWVVIGKQYDLFYASLPYPMFDINVFYKKGSYVFWRGSVYQANTDSAISNINNIQYLKYQYVPPNNYFPDQVNTFGQWSAGVPYSVEAGTLPNISPLWTKGDNRSQQMVQTLADLVIFYIHQRISPQNIPVNRTESFKAAVQWLKDAGEGVVTPKLPRKQPNQGNRIRWGGNIKNINTY